MPGSHPLVPPAPTGPRTRRLLPPAAGVVAFLAFAAIGLARWTAGLAGSYDLGIFAQAAKGWASGRGPVSDVRAPDYLLLREHFSPVTALFAPAWWVWPDARALVVVQALLLAVAVAVVARAAVRRLAGVPATALTVGFAGSFGVLSAVRFDVHEVAFAVPLLALTCRALLDERPRAALAWAAPLVLVKEDLGATVCAVAVVLWWRGHRRPAVAAAAVGVVGAVVAMATIAHFNTEGTSPFLASFTGGSSTPAVPAGTRLASVAVLLLVLLLTGGVVWVRSPLALLVVPTLLWRLASGNPLFWMGWVHYDLVLMPVVAFALLDVLSRRRAPRGAPRWVRAGALSCAVGTAVVLAVVHPPLAGVGAARGADVPAQARAATADVPEGASLAADNGTGPALVGRFDVRFWSEDVSTRAQWLVLDTARSSFRAPVEGKLATLAALRATPGVQVRRDGRFVVVRLPCEQTVRQLAPAGPGRPAPVWEGRCG
ncbi:DUF2079 domain-containing protein [Kineococcus sp. LSe6-4]|uniref:DUF2079 domain-containing protein n=1 Tax=Kineococcus halophytocola TaxID=3234027 RepID=A0ABV4GXZ2_9ACTN